MSYTIEATAGEVHKAGHVAVRGRALEVAWWGPGSPGTGRSESGRRSPLGSASLRASLAESHRLIVMLHEGLGSVSRWRTVPARISEATGLGVMAFSRFGYGRSDAVPLPRSVDYLYEEAELLPEVLEAAGLGKRELVLFGHSDGGSIALIHTASGRASNVRGLVLEAPHVFVEDLSIASITKAREEFLTTDLEERMKKHHQDVHTAFWGWNDAWLHPEFRRFDIQALLPKIEAPVLVIQGEEDPYGTFAQVEAITEKLPRGADVLMIPGARHSAHTDAPEAVLEAVHDFVSGLG